MSVLFSIPQHEMCQQLLSPELGMLCVANIKTFGMLLLTRVHVAADVHLVGYHHFWTSVLNSLQVDIPHQLHLKLLAMDKEKVVRFHRDHEFKSKAKRKRLEHEKLNALFVEYQKDVSRNATYKS